jgi:hypothetical protein
MESEQRQITTQHQYRTLFAHCERLGPKLAMVGIRHTVERLRPVAGDLLVDPAIELGIIGCAGRNAV